MNKNLGILRKKNYFEGWYFKHQKKEQIAAFIPGICKGEDGESHAFIQMLFNHKSYYVSYDIAECHIKRRRQIIRIGNNIFSKQGIRLDIDNEEIKVKGILSYKDLHPLKHHIMGPFLHLPKMECKHEIISMNHKLKGELVINEETMNFSGGVGYIEKDWGNSFPTSYTWLACNWFEEENCSIMVSIAHIPYGKISFKGCICAISYNEKIYRLATYFGVKVLACNKQRIYLKQGKYLLKILMYDNPSFSHNLYAPQMGAMARTIAESHLCYARFLFYEKKQLVFDLTSKEVSMECVE